MWARLVEEAKEAALCTYSPYSGFPVGAAILCRSGQIFRGCNIENASYGLTQCAERAAISSAVSAGDQSGLTAIVVYTPTADPVTPCGACRQVLREFASNAEILCVCRGERQIRTSLRRLLPASFGPDDLDGASGKREQAGKSRKRGAGKR